MNPFITGDDPRAPPAAPNGDARAMQDKRRLATDRRAPTARVHRATAPQASADARGVRANAPRAVRAPRARPRRHVSRVRAVPARDAAGGVGDVLRSVA